MLDFKSFLIGEKEAQTAKSIETTKISTKRGQGKLNGTGSWVKICRWIVIVKASTVPMRVPITALEDTTTKAS